MKKYNKTKTSALLIITSMILLASFRIHYIQQEKNELIGIWKSIDDPKWIWEFKSDGKLYSLYEGKLLTTFSFSVETTSPQCGYTVKEGPLFKYLKLMDLSNNLTQCYEFASFDNDFIEVRKLGSGGFMGFKKSTSSIEEPDDNFDFGDGDQKIN